MILQNNTILITGGSSGIGLELAKRLIEKNNKVIICSRSKDKLEKAKTEIHTNLLAPIILTKLFIPILEKNPKPKLINITSGLAYVPKADYPFFNATKSALHSFTQTLRMQMDKSAIDILEVFLPPVDTPFHKGNPPKKVITVEKAVDKMISGIEKGEIEIRVGITKLIYLISRIAPKFASKKVNN